MTPVLCEEAWGVFEIHRFGERQMDSCVKRIIQV